MMEMSAQTLPVVTMTGINMGSERRTLTTTRTRRQRARDLASSQIAFAFFDLEACEQICTLKPEPGTVLELVYSTPTLRETPVYKESVAPTFADRVHVLDRTDLQCGFPTWADDEKDLASHFACGARKRRTTTYCCSHMALAYGKPAT